MTQTELESLKPGTPVIVVGSYRVWLCKFEKLTKTQVVLQGGRRFDRRSRTSDTSQYERGIGPFQSATIRRVATDADLKWFESNSKRDAVERDYVHIGEFSQYEVKKS